MSVVLDPLLAPPETAQLLQLHRYRAEYVSRELWRVFQQRTGWKVAVARPSSEGGGAIVAGGGSLGSLKAAYLDVIVPAAARLDVDEHLLRVWRGSLREARRTLNADEEFAFEEFLHRNRHNSIFRLVGAGVRRNEGASPDLARAALKLLSAAEVKETDR